MLRYTLILGYLISASQGFGRSIPPNTAEAKLQVLEGLNFVYPKVHAGERVIVRELKSRDSTSYHGRHLLTWLQSVQKRHGRILIDCFLYVQIAALVLDDKTRGKFVLEFGQRTRPWRHRGAFYFSINRQRFLNAYVAMQKTDSANKGVWVIQISPDRYRYLAEDGSRDTSFATLLREQLAVLRSEASRAPLYDLKTYEEVGFQPIAKVLGHPVLGKIIFEPANWWLDPN